MDLASPKTIKDLLGKYSLAPLKKFGQNFLCDENVVNKIADAAVPSGGNIMEIGPGLGVLTRALALRAEKVVAVEIDSGMVEVLKETLGDLPNVCILNEDILKTDMDVIFNRYFDGKEFYVCGNLPYYITSKCILKIVEAGLPIKQFTAMVQKEVAGRLSSGPGTAEYGALSASVGFYGGAEKLFDVSRHCFYPRPDVDSSVIRVVPGRVVDVPRQDYVKVVRGLFAMRRKTILNNLQSSFGLSRKEAENLLNDLEIAPSLRAESLSVLDFARIAKKNFKK